MVLGARNVLIDKMTKSLPPCILHSSGRSSTKNKPTNKQETEEGSKLCEEKINIPHLSSKGLPLHFILMI